LTSPVTDQGHSFGLTTDQRGAPRPYDFVSITQGSSEDASDIGPFELGSSKLGGGKYNPGSIGAGVILFWPAYYADFVVQYTTDLTGSNSWYDLPASPVEDNGQLTVIDTPTRPTTYYRLKTR